MDRLIAGLKGGLLFMLVGPLIGALLMTVIVWVILMLVVAAPDPKASGMLLAMMLIGGYFIGSLPALLTGIIAGLCSHHLNELSSRLILALVGSLLTMLYDFVLDIGGYWIDLPIGFLSTLICIAIYRRFVVQSA